jgi:hypothetical protein
MSRAGRDEGFTFIEALLALSLSLVVFTATMTLVIVVLHSVQGNNARNDAQDRARLGIDLIARQLRNIASPITSPKLIERASAYELVFQTIASPNGADVSGAERVRYCVPNDTTSGSVNNEVLIGQTQTWNTASSPATIPWNASTCPDTSPSDGNSATGAYKILASAVTNRYKQRTDRPLFYFNDSSTPPSDLSQVRSVQIDLFVNPTPKPPAAEDELRSGVFLRNQVRPPVAYFTSTPTGNGGVLLNGGISYSPDNYDLSFSWSCVSSGCPSASFLSGATDGLVDWKPGAGTYTVSLTVTDATGLASTPYTQQVTVQ